MNAFRYECNAETTDCTQAVNNGLPCACNLPQFTGKNGYCTDPKPQCKVGGVNCKTVICAADGTTNGLPCDCINPNGFGYCKSGTVECLQSGSDVKCN